jgi:tetratricopeptide (TPR) repeat protein
MNFPTKVKACVLASLFLAAGAFAQSRGSTSSSSTSGSAGRTIGRDTSPINAENSLEIIKPPAPAEEKAYKAFQKFQAMPNGDLAKKIQAGEDFLKKFPSTSYSAPVYSFLTAAYIQSGAVDKGVAAGEKDLQLNPQDFRTMAIMSQGISRTVTASTPDKEAQLAKADTFAKNAIQGMSTVAKPEGMSDANFSDLKNQTLAMAHGSLGLVQVHKNEFEAAIPELEQAVSLGSNQDFTDYYLLGVANQNSGHSDKAVTAFEKCAAVKSNVQAACATGAEQSRKDAAKDATQAKPN